MRLKYFFSVLSFFVVTHAQAGLAELQYLTANYLAFTQSQLIRYQTSPVFEETRRRSPTCALTYVNNIEYAVALNMAFGNFEYILEDAMQATDYPREVARNHFISESLTTILQERFKWLEIRLEKWQRHQTNELQDLISGKTTKFSYVSTTPDQIAIYTPGLIQYEVALTALTEFQMYNRLIRELYDMLPSSWIAGDTDLTVLLRASVSLHPFLMRETEDAGFPEHAFLRDRLVSRDERQKQADVEFYREYFKKETVYVPSLMIGASRARKDWMRVQLTQAEAYELGGQNEKGDPANQPLRPLPSIKPLFRAKQLQENPPEVKVSKPGLVSTVTELSWERTEVTVLPPSIEVKKEPAVTTATATATTTATEKSEVATPLVQTVQRRLRKKTEKPKTKSLQSVEVLPTPDPVAARGNRVFHSNRPEVEKISPELLRRLSGKQHSWLRSLFNHELDVVRFRDFKAVWTTLEGKIGTLGARGSHAELKDAKNRVVGGIFAHSESTEYYLPYHQFLRDAFGQLGISKEDLN